MTTTELAALLAGLLAGWAAAELPKAQGVRLLDVALLGPLMAYVATQPGAATALPRLALLAAAGATVSYNGRNYLRARAATSVGVTEVRADPMAPLGA